MDNDTVTTPRTRDDSGFGLIEIVVSMFMLALLSISFLPILITAIKASATNATLATGTQLVNQQLELAASTALATPNCAAMKSYAAATTASIGTLTDRNGTVQQPRRELKVIASQTDSLGCPLSYPGTVAVRIWVTPSTGSTVIVEATELFYVGSAS